MVYRRARRSRWIDDRRRRARCRAKLPSPYGSCDISFATAAPLTKAGCGRFDAYAAPLGLMVRSRDLGPAQIPRPRARRLEPWGRPILRDGRYAQLRFLDAHVLAPSSG